MMKPSHKSFLKDLFETNSQNAFEKFLQTGFGSQKLRLFEIYVDRD